MRVGLTKRGLAALSQRERDVLALLINGSSNRQIAVELVITEATVETHLHHIFRKLGVRSRTEAAVYALIHGTDMENRLLQTRFVE